MEKTPEVKSQSGKEFAAGFLGWFVLANVVFGVMVIFYQAQEFSKPLAVLSFGIWVPTTLAIAFFFVNKINTIASGILAAVICNTFLSGGMFLMMPFPQPIGFLVYMSAIMDMMSPPYSNLIHLFSFH